MTVDKPPDFVDDFAQTRVTIYMGFISFSILVWDHIVTFSDEVEYIWKGHKGPLVYLFLLNRYLTPLGFIINLFAYMSPSWTISSCQHFVRYEGSMTVIGINTTALMMLLRIYALYSTKLFVVAGVAIIFFVELSVNAWLLTNGVAVTHNTGIHTCTMIFKDSIRPIAAASAWLPLLYDTIVLLLTLNRTVGPVRRKTAGKIIRVLLRDGILYYSVIFSVNFVLTIMIVAAPQGIQNITAQLEYLLTVSMMSRITLHLRKQARARDIETEFIGFASTDTIQHGVRSRLRFNNRSAGRGITTDPQLTVTVEESAVVHDDDGNLLGDSQDDDGERRKMAEWYEMQMRPKTPPVARISGKMVRDDESYLDMP